MTVISLLASAADRHALSGAGVQVTDEDIAYAIGVAEHQIAGR